MRTTRRGPDGHDMLGCLGHGLIGLAQHRIDAEFGPHRHRTRGTQIGHIGTRRGLYGMDDVA